MERRVGGIEHTGCAREGSAQRCPLLAQARRGGPQRAHIFQSARERVGNTRQRIAGLHDALSQRVGRFGNGIEPLGQRPRTLRQGRRSLVAYESDSLAQRRRTLRGRGGTLRNLIQSGNKFAGTRGGLVKAIGYCLRPFDNPVIAFIKQRRAVCSERQLRRLALDIVQHRNEIILPSIAAKPCLQLLKRRRTGTRGQYIRGAARDDLDRRLVRVITRKLAMAAE